MTIQYSQKVVDALPWLSFPETWKVKIIPPFNGATVRFLVSLPGREFNVSVYADYKSNLGVLSYPYWEIYPNALGDTQRFKINQADEMINAIGESLTTNQED